MQYEALSPAYLTCNEGYVSHRGVARTHLRKAGFVKLHYFDELTLDQLVEVQILVPQFINAVFETKLRVAVHIRPYACYISPDRRHA